MQKIGSCGGERFALATLINQEKPVEEEEVKEVQLWSLALLVTPLSLPSCIW